MPAITPKIAQPDGVDDERAEREPGRQPQRRRLVDAVAGHRAQRSADADEQPRHAGNPDGEAGAAGGPVLDPDIAAVQPDEVLDDRQAQAGAAGLARARLVDAVEALEDALAIGLGDARPFVLDDERDVVAVAHAPRD